MCWIVQHLPRSKPKAMGDRLWSLFKSNIWKNHTWAQSILHRSSLRGLHHMNLNKPISDWTVTQSLSYLQVTDPRDHIYSILGLVDLPIIVDYNKSMQQICYEFALLGIPQHPHRHLNPCWRKSWKATHE